MRCHEPYPVGTFRISSRTVALRNGRHRSDSVRAVHPRQTNCRCVFVVQSLESMASATQLKGSVRSSWSSWESVWLLCLCLGLVHDARTVLYIGGLHIPSMHGSRSQLAISYRSGSWKCCLLSLLLPGGPSRRPCRSTVLVELSHQRGVFRHEVIVATLSTLLTSNPVFELPLQFFNFQLQCEVVRLNRFVFDDQGIVVCCSGLFRTRRQSVSSSPWRNQTTHIALL